jgi:Fe-S cluster biogenesis protein NfuA
VSNPGTPSSARRGAELSETGARIDALLDASTIGGVLARERSEELVRLLTDLYGAGLERFMTVLYDNGRLDDQLLDLLAGDELISSLLLVHGLHPYSVETRVGQALDSVRPYLGSHGGDVELLEVSTEGTVRLRLLGTCDGCPSSSVTLQLAVEGAIHAAAPEVTNIEVDAPTSGASSASHNHGPLISVESLSAHLHPAEFSGSSWHRVLDLDLQGGALTSIMVGGSAVAVCQVGADLYAFLDRCARCESSLAGAVLVRRLGGAAHDAVLRCPQCGVHYDVARAGACLDIDDLHLDPLPLLADSAGVSIAVPVSALA